MSLTPALTEESPFAAIGEALVQTVEAAVPKLRSMSESRAGQPRAPGKWSPKQVIGHLIDSASNNHQRFVRAQEGTRTLARATRRTTGSPCRAIRTRRGTTSSRCGAPTTVI